VVLALAICLLAFAFTVQAIPKKLPPPSKPIDLNLATSEQLQRLPGVGPVTAQRILDYRKKSGPFQSVDDLLAVKGISAKRLDKIRQYLVVKAPPAPAQAPPKVPPKKL
jgi:competence ComEA-like helix-hairpin-helix protein